MRLARVIALLVAVAASVLAAVPSIAAAADDLQPRRTLFLSERFGPSSIRGTLPSNDVLPEHMLALRGEREGFQLALRNETGSNLRLAARVLIDPSDPLDGASNDGSVTVDVLRVRFVNVPHASSRVETATSAPGSYAAGWYADPLPPLRSASTLGRLLVPAGQWGGVVVLVKVRTDAPATTYGATIELYDPVTSTVYAREPFSIVVRGKRLLQAGDAGAFTTVMNVEGDAYWLQHEGMRRGPANGYPTEPDRLLQLQGLMSFLDSRGITPNEYPYAVPAASGAYSCQYTAMGTVAPFSMLTQLQQRYLAPPRDIDPASSQFPVTMMPAKTKGCQMYGSAGFDPTVDVYRTPSIKQDDVLHPSAGTFLRNVAAAWASRGLHGRASYVKNPFDEPSDRGANATYTARFQTQYRTHVPAANRLLRSATGGRAKVVLADWPRDSSSRRVCRRFGTGQRCTTMSGDTFSNRFLWDGSGSDDTDVWMAPFSRLFGRPVPSNVARLYGVNRDREYATRLARIKSLRGGREVWAYNFFTANALQPQLTIDAPATDARMNYWLLGREGHTGLFVSNLMVGWGTVNDWNRDGTRRKGNPYDGALYFQHGTYGRAAGWGTFIYPGYAPELGLASEADRNTAQAYPVTSLRLEGMRDGQEDANLMRMYRTRYGAASLQRVLLPVFPNVRYRALPRQLGQVVTPVYDNGNVLAQRMERQRRAMLRAVAAPS